jgi:glycosyltransferase involved in cell wall biosynthesis
MTDKDHSFQVSAVIATYNSAAEVTATLQSIVRQTLDCVKEIIVVDDASTDESCAVVMGFGDPRIRLVALDSNQGVSRARQIGMEAARFPWIAFNDADDVWLDDKLERQFALLQAHPEAIACVGGNGRLHRDGRSQWRTGFGPWQWCPEDGPSSPKPPFFKPVLDGNVYLQSLVVRREAALCEAFKPELTLMQDQDYLLRLGRHGTFVITDRPVFLYRLGFSNTTASGRMRARVFLANRDYLYLATEAFNQGVTEPDVASYLRGHVAKPIDIEAFEVGQRFRHFNTIWVQKGLLAAIWVLGVMFLQHPTQTVRFIARRLMYWGKR